MPSLSNDLIMRLNQIGIIALGRLNGSQGPFRSHGQHCTLNSESTQSTMAPMTAVIRLIYVSLLNKHLLRARAVGWRLIPLQRCWPRASWDAQLRLTEKMEEQKRRSSDGHFYMPARKVKQRLRGRCGGESSKVAMVSSGMWCRVCAGNSSSCLEFSLEIDNHLNVCSRKSQEMKTEEEKDKGEESPAAGGGTFTGVMV